MVLVVVLFVVVVLVVLVVRLVVGMVSLETQSGTSSLICFHSKHSDRTDRGTNLVQTVWVLESTAQSN